MTPELRETNAILKLYTLELSSFIEEQLLENPLLEVVEEPTDSLETKTGDKEIKDETIEDKSDINWDEYFQQQDDIPREYSSTDPDAEEKRFEPFLAEGPTLQE